MNNHQKGLLITLAGVLILTPDTMIMRLIDQDAHVMTFWRSILFGGIFVLFGLFRYRLGLVTKIKQAGWIGLWLMLSFAFSSYCFIVALSFTKVANLLIFLALSPLWSSLLSRILMKERLAPETLIAIGLCFIGIIIVFQDGLSTEFSIYGELLAMMCSIFLSINLTLIRMRPDIDVVPINGIGSLSLGLILLPFVSIAMPFEAMMLTLFLSLVIIPVSFFLILTGPRYITSAEVGLLMLLESILGPFWVWLAVGEVPSLYIFIGGGLILTTLVAHSLWRLKFHEQKGTA